MKEIFLKRTGLFYAGLIVVICISAAVAHFVQAPYGNDCRLYTVSILLETEEEAGLEIYYDIGRGFHETDHQEQEIVTSGEPVELLFTVPVWKKFTKLRLDPVGASLNMKIYGIEVVSADNSFRHSVSLADINPVREISKAEWNGTYYSFETLPDAVDPVLLEESINDPQRQPAEKSPFVYGLWICGSLFSMLFANWIYRFFILGL